MSWKTLESPGSNQRHLSLADRKTLRFINSAKSSTTKQMQMVHWWILGACLSNQRRKPQRMLIMPKECRSFDVCIDLYTATLSRFGSGPCIRRPTAVHAGAIAPGTRSCQTRTQSTLFFFWSEKKGGSSAPSEPPLATCLVPLGWTLPSCFRLHQESRHASRQSNSKQTLRTLTHQLHRETQACITKHSNSYLRNRTATGTRRLQEHPPSRKRRVSVCVCVCVCVCFHFPGKLSNMEDPFIVLEFLFIWYFAHFWPAHSLSRNEKP